MKSCVLLAVAAGTSGLCAAQEFGQVISSTPVVQQVAVPRQVCSNELVQMPSQTSGAGAVLGAIAGGAVGNSIGNGGGRAAATMIGLVGGALLGNRIEGPSGSQVQNMQRCTTQTWFENRVSYYNVVYEYAGKQYAVQMPHDPGPTLRLQITPADATLPFPPAAPLSYAQPPVPQTFYSEPVFVAVEPPRYPGYYVQPYRPPVGINFQFGYSGGNRGHYGHSHGNWR